MANLTRTYLTRGFAPFLPHYDTKWSLLTSIGTEGECKFARLPSDLPGKLLYVRILGLFFTLVWLVCKVCLFFWCVTFSDDWKLLGEEEQCQATLTIKMSDSRKEFVEYCGRNSADPCISSSVTWVHLCWRVFKWASCRTKSFLWVFLFCCMGVNRSVATVEDIDGVWYFLRLEGSSKCLVIVQSDDTYLASHEYNEMIYQAAVLEYCDKPSYYSPKLMVMQSTSYRLRRRPLRLSVYSYYLFQMTPEGSCDLSAPTDLLPYRLR